MNVLALWFQSRRSSILAGAAQHRGRRWRSTAQKAWVAHWRSKAYIDAEAYFQSYCYSSTDMPDGHFQKTTLTRTVA